MNKHNELHGLVTINNDKEVEALYLEAKEELLNAHDEQAKGDVRYNVPKKDHGFSNQEIDIVIDSTSIYSEAKEELLNAQRRQVGYGMGKYPEALTAESWDIIETLNHDIEETADSLHYKIMLRQKLTKLIEEGVIVE